MNESEYETVSKIVEKILSTKEWSYDLGGRCFKVVKIRWFNP